ncbi:hypothetical protein FRACA_1030016 [Frankia canadensis]|uniref:Uncharacterized protein n=1 Tax=Frankia canadensis TaxID=1836972 RepID=A0A2I2KIT4_9ACTN|nr:hypothetical protein [Frankia canadensis]SNQ45582.1 hypothetical protein FRACA_1030016 [Frankia canadensis]SOU52872.1 hypothetical protein FRACA_1030016 [Frankia canadensis]
MSAPFQGLGEGRVPRPQCLADEYALWLVIQNTDPPQIGDVLDTFSGLRGTKDVFGYDPDADDPGDEAAIREEWMNRMVGSLIPLPGGGPAWGPARRAALDRS